MAVIALSAWLSGIAMDKGVSPRIVASAVGVSMIIPILLWASALRLWKQDASRASICHPEPKRSSPFAGVLFDLSSRGRFGRGICSF